MVLFSRKEKVSSKQFLRDFFLKKRSNFSINYRNKAECSIAKTLLEILKMFSYQNLLAYAPHKGEVDIFSVLRVLKKTKKIAFPKVLGKNKMKAVACDLLEKDLERGFAGILEPKKVVEKRAAKAIDFQADVVLVPGVGFNLSKHRLGYGGGYYDSFLASSRNQQALTIGCFFNEQLCVSPKNFKIEKQDQPMDLIVTERGIYI